MMKKRKLGNQGLEVSALGLGCMGMSWSYGTPDDAESIATIHRALDIGINFFDTAEMYGPFTNEMLVGKALRGRRSQAIIATKFGFHIENGMPNGELNSHPKHIRQVVDESLTRLQTDHIDLLYQHRFDPKIPIEDVVGTMSDLIHEGKVRFLGLSEVGVEVLTRAHRTHPISALQSEYSLWERNLEEEVIPAARKLGIGLVPFSPLGRGFLTGTAKASEDYAATDFRTRDPRFQGENFARNMAATKRLFEIAGDLKITPAQVAIAWVMAKGDDLVAIPGTKRRKYLDENVHAASITLEPNVMMALDAIFADPNAVSGPRYGEALMKLVNR